MDHDLKMIAEKMDRMLALLESYAGPRGSYPFMCGTLISHVRAMAGMSPEQINEHVDRFTAIYAEAIAREAA